MTAARWVYLAGLAIAWGSFAFVVWRGADPWDVVIWPALATTSLTAVDLTAATRRRRGKGRATDRPTN